MMALDNCKVGRQLDKRLGSIHLILYVTVTAIAHGSPRPKNTFTLLDPVTLPMAESADRPAYSEVLAAVILAKVSGNEVPRATRVMAVIDS